MRNTNTNKSSLSHFESTELSSFKDDPEKTQPPSYEKMNLWLYQFNIEEEISSFKSGENKRKSQSKY